jgi:hypothetical protein
MARTLLPNTGLPGLDLVSTTTIGSAVSSISLAAGTFTTRYNSYKIIFDCTETTAMSASADITFRLRASGTDNSSAVYNYQGWTATTTLSVTASSSATSQIIGKTLNSSPNRFSTVIDIHGPATAVETKYHILNTGMNGGTNTAYGLNGYHGTQAAYDSMTFLLSTGTITNGKIRVYGYNN